MEILSTSSSESIIFVYRKILSSIVLRYGKAFLSALKTSWFLIKFKMLLSHEIEIVFELIVNTAEM